MSTGGCTPWSADEGLAGLSSPWCVPMCSSGILRRLTGRWRERKSARPKPSSGRKRPSRTSPMKRGEVWWVNFKPAVGGEVRKQRPAVIVSNDAANKYLNRLQVVPCTSSVERLYPSEAHVTI